MYISVSHCKEHAESQAVWSTKRAKGNNTIPGPQAHQRNSAKKIRHRGHKRGLECNTHCGDTCRGINRST